MTFFPKFTVKLIAISALFGFSVSAAARDQIRIVGSSTVYPFATVVAEEFGTKTDYRTPIVESTGTGGGMKLFCSGVGDSFPDVTNASRKIKDSEVALCKANGVESITEVKIGYDGIVIANKRGAKKFDLTKEQIFSAVAKKIAHKGKLIENTNQKWSDIDASLPDQKIEVYGPPPTSGTRDAFVEIVLESQCMKAKEFIAAFPDEKIRKKQCHLIREDGFYIESGENDNLIVQKLKNNEKALGIFGYSFLEQNIQDLQGKGVNGVEPSFENIANGSYSVSRSLFMYFKNAHLEKISGLKEFLEELVSDEAIGEDGYLLIKGLIPLTEEERSKIRDSIDQLNSSSDDKEKTEVEDISS